MYQQLKIDTRSEEEREGPIQERSLERQLRQLSPLLVWAVVFCDIGTSVYYVPGILYSQVGDPAALFVIATTVGFLLLSVKYIDICRRNPEGGGVVTVATKAFTPRWGVLGGMLITVDYFLTSAISSCSGMYYLTSLFPSLEGFIVPMVVITLILLAILNTIGIRESAAVALIMAVAALGFDFAVIGVTLVSIGPPEWSTILHYLSLGKNMSLSTFLVGFGGAWLAFSGLESISQVSSAMRLPLKSTARKGMLLVVAAVLLTSPLLTLFSVALLPDSIRLHESERFISELGGMWGGLIMKAGVVVTASVLLLFASNTAIIGTYHVFLALSTRGYLPSLITVRNRYFNTPHFAIAVATIVPIFVVIFTQGHMATLGDMYAFGLLGAFVLSSAGLDVLRWRTHQRGFGFWIGILTTLMVVVAWSVNLVSKQLATLFGGSLVIVGMTISIAWQQKWFGDFFYQIPMFARFAQRRISQAEHSAEDIPWIISLSQAEALLSLYPSHTLVALRGRNANLISEAIAREKARGGNTIYALYVEERTGLFSGPTAFDPDQEGIQTLRFAAHVAESQHFTLIPVWTLSYNAAEAIARAAQILRVDAVMVGVSKRSALYHLLRGHVVKGLSRRLPRDCHMILYS